MIAPLLAAAAALAVPQPTIPQPGNSLPQPLPVPATIPEAQDRAFPGVIALAVDATDIDRRIYTVRETIPVAGPGPLTLLFPQWLPGNHAPRGQIEKLAGLVIRSGAGAGGRVLPWTRDPVDVNAFHLDVPPGTAAVEASFQFLSATAADQGRVQWTREINNLQWEAVSLYPAGWFVRRIPVQASVTWPAGWRAATALRPVASAPVAGGTRVTYGTVGYDVLVDSPVFAGKYFRADDLGHGVTLNTVADSPAALAAPDAVIARHRALVDQAVKLFGARHFDHYDFLHAVTDRLGDIGLEHHRSSENSNGSAFFTDFDGSLTQHNLLAHEFTHSWDGKFRRGADLWTPDYRTPMRNSLLWVYEGQTQFWGHMLEARAGLTSKADKLDNLAVIAATLQARRGREWRPLIDTTNDPVITPRRPKAWLSWQRSEDYYNEGLLIWTEVDAMLREGTGGRRGMDDFAAAFFGVRDGDWGELTYTLDDVAATLGTLMPYDWRGFLTRRLTETGAAAPLGGFERSGYRLVFADTPTRWITADQRRRQQLDLSFSIGMIVKAGKLSFVAWDGPAFRAGLSPGLELVAVNGVPYSDAALLAAITAAKGSGAPPVRLIVKDEGSVREVAVPYRDGLRYPRFEKVGAGDGPLDRLLAPR